jgi:hypothetical protein
VTLLFIEKACSWPIGRIELFFILLNMAIKSLLFSVGCHKEQQVIDLYVEAVILSGLGKNKMAIERLNEVVKSAWS